MRTVVALLASGALSFLAAQEPEPEVVFRTGTRLVQVDVVVKAKDVPVEGLKREDFELYDRGKRQPISVFSLRKIDPQHKPQPPLPPGVVANVPRTSGEEPLAATVVLIDYLNTPTDLQMSVRQQALKYLASAPPRESIAVYTLNATLAVKQNFSDDMELLRTTIDHSRPEVAALAPMDFGPGGPPTGMAGNGVVASMQAGRARSADITSAAFATIARHLGSLPGRKKLIWITTGMPLVFNDDTERNGKTSHEYQNLSARVYAPMKMLNDGNIALYALNPTPAGLLDLASESLGTLLQLTKMTGGKVYFGSNDQAGLLRAALADTDITYTLGFYPPSEEPAGASHKLEVKLTRAAVERHPSAELRYRQSYSAETKTEAMTDKRRKQLIEAWLAEPLNATAIAFTARATPEKRPDYRLVQIGLDAGQLAWEQKDGRWLTQLEWTITPDGRDKPKGVTQVVKLNLPEAKYRNLVATGVVMENAIPVADAKGKLKTKRLSVVVIDAKSGKAGSVRIPLE